MVEQLKVTGMVLSAAPVQEYDSRLVILTRERGKITAFARGARRQNSPYLAACRPFTFGVYTVYQGKNAYQLMAAEPKNYFIELSKDFYHTSMGFYFLEISDYLYKEGIEATEPIQLLYASFQALLNPHIPDELVRAVFELKTMVINGIYPDVFACACCQTKEHLKWYDARHEQIFCEHCKEHAGNLQEINSSLLYAMQFIIATPIGRLYTFALKEDVLQQLCKISHDLIKRHVHKQFHSLEILEKLK